MYLFQAARRALTMMAFRRFATTQAEGKPPPNAVQTVALVSVISAGIMGPGMYLLLTRPKFAKE